MYQYRICENGSSKNADFKKHLNQYDVIHLDIQWCLEPAGGAEQVVPYISERTIAELKEYYPDALSEEQNPCQKLYRRSTP